MYNHWSVNIKSPL